MGDLARLRELIAQRQAHRSDPEPTAVPPAWQADPPEVAATWPRPLAEDPRPDLEGSALWSRLLLLASGDADDPRGVYGRLLGARACGGRLERRADRWRLAPTIDPTERLSVWATEADWQADAERWLRPHAQEIVVLLRQLPGPAEGEA
ncbi:MAG: hypothetical protein M0027_05905 [Candidatus Dormibacteraeota bacterium]|jgi:hypothetical protein|nr:hypothetical protein [Candidatus Dormibacteraeota bacterium]